MEATKTEETTPHYTAKLVWFDAGPAWTCQLDGKHVITIHTGDTAESKAKAEATAADLNAKPPNA